MDFWPGIIELLTAVFDFLRRTFAHFWYICFLMSMAYVRPSGGLLSEMCNIAQVLQHFLKGHIGAILTLGSYHDEIAIFHIFRKVDFCNTSAVKSIVSKWVKLHRSDIENFSIWNMHFYHRQSTSFKSATNPRNSWERLGMTGGRGRGGLKPLP